ncbi:MAG: 50S ribosomal protein L10 [Patescibacteria group bacterium]
MPKTKLQKSEIIRTINAKLDKMKSAVLVNFSGIEVKNINKLRDECREQEIDYMVAKKTLLKKALAEKGLKETADQELGGEIAALFGYQDEVAPARLAAKFAKEYENLKLVGGILEGAYIDGAKVLALSKLPSRQELLAKAIGSMAAPLSGLVNVLQGNLRGLVYTLNAIKEKKA